MKAQGRTNQEGINVAYILLLCLRRCRIVAASSDDNNVYILSVRSVPRPDAAGDGIFDQSGRLPLNRYILKYKKGDENEINFSC